MSFDITILSAKNSSSKAYKLEADRLVKVPQASSHSTPYSGVVKSFETLAGFRDHLASMQPDMINLYGVPTKNVGTEEFLILPKWEVESVIDGVDTNDQERVFSRTKENFQFPIKKSSIFMVDIDDSEDIDSDITKILTAVPQLANAQYVRQFSSSSNIFYNGKLLKKPTGVHLYWLFDDASAVPSIAKIIFDTLVLKGHGHIKLASNGAMLTRSLIDMMVYQPERIDFAGGALLLSEGLTQHREPILLNAHLPAVVQTASIKPLTAKQTKEVAAIWNALKGNAEPLSLAKSDAWVKEAKTED